MNKDEKEEDIEIEQDDTLDDSVLGEESLQSKVKRLKEKLKECEKERMEYLTGWQKAKADFINLRKQDEQDKSNFAKYAKIEILKDFVPVLDSFESAKKSEWWASAKEDWRNGVESIYKQLYTQLEKEGLIQYYPLNEGFDPNYHEAVGTREVSDKSQDHIILEVVQPGFRTENKVIRTAKVVVGTLNK